MNLGAPIRILLLGALCSPAAAQSFNVDLGPEGAGPPASYRAAGLPGYWHSFPATTWGLYHDLSDLNGDPSVVRVRQIGGTEVLDVPLGGPGQPQGGDAILLGDALVTHQIENCLYFVNLVPGTYEVLTYAWMPTAPLTLSHTWIDDHPDEFDVGGAWGGSLAQGKIYSRHEFEVTASVINMHSGIPDGGAANPGAALNGVQIRLMGPEPPLFFDGSLLEWLRALDAASYDVVRGDLGTLRSSGGDFTAATTACMANGIAKQDVASGADPAPGQGTWYLVRADDTFGALTWNSGGDAQDGDRDPEIDGAAGGCP